MGLPRIMLSGVSSGSGKTMLTCGLLLSLISAGLNPAAFKCGPDYIDPMFHAKVTGSKTGNLDLYFTSEETVRSLLLEGSHECDLAVMEGVMGYYDGLGGKTDEASAYHLAKATNTPVVLIIDVKGASLSICATIKGFLGFREDSGIKAVILNRCTKMQYSLLKPLIEEECKVEVMGYLPSDARFTLESRHLGLVTADEVHNIREKIELLADTLAETISIDRLIVLAKSAGELTGETIIVDPVTSCSPLIAVAKDRAFCFYYRENLELLERLGAKLCFFSPMTDKNLPEKTSALYLGGGYPELYGKELSENMSLRQEIKSAVKAGLPTFAECGGFMYLHRSMTDESGKNWDLAGVVNAGCYFTGALRRFGYVELKAKNDNLLCEKGGSIRAHEFHYFESEAPGDDFYAKKPLRETGWDCIHSGKSLFAGFPHMYLYSNPSFAQNFVKAAASYEGSKK